MESNVCIKFENDQEVKEEPMDDMTTVVNAPDGQETAEMMDKEAPAVKEEHSESHNDQSLLSKDELILENDWFLNSDEQSASPSIVLKDETFECEDDCLDCEASMQSNGCIKEEIDQEVIRVKEEPIDDSVTLASSTGGQEVSHQIDMQLDAHYKQLFPVKEEHLPENAFLTITGTPSVSPSFALKVESCQCEDCDDCIEAQQREQSLAGKDSSPVFTSSDDHSNNEASDSDETIVDEPMNDSAAPVANSHPKPSKRSPPCPECGKTFVSNSTLTIHLRVHTGERPFTCDQCAKTFTQLGNLTQHQATHQAERSRPFRCSDEGCGRAFPTKRELTVHLRSHTGERPFVCAQCPQAFTYLGTLKRHQTTHQAVRVRPFLCTAEGCGKTFLTKGDLTIHSRLHTGERPYKCDNCGKAFTKSGSLTIHLRSHTSERPHVCAQCPKAFKESGALKQHQATHQAEGNRPFRCTTEGCGKTFTRKGELTVHFRSHTGERPYQCTLCPKAFAQSSNVKKHQRNVHARSP